MLDQTLLCSGCRQGSPPPISPGEGRSPSAYKPAGEFQSLVHLVSESATPCAEDEEFHLLLLVGFFSGGAKRKEILAADASSPAKGAGTGAGNGISASDPFGEAALTSIAG